MSMDLVARLIEAGTPAALVAEVAMLAAQVELAAPAPGYRRPSAPSDWQERRNTVFERDGWKCVYCGAQPDDLHCDHVVPLSRGGTHDLDNLAAACSGCNTSKGNKLLSEWQP